MMGAEAKNVAFEMLERWPRGRHALEGHAFFKDDYFQVNGEKKSIQSNRDAYEAAIAYWEGKIEAAETEFELMSMINPSHREEWLRESRPYLDSETYSKLLCEADVKDPEMLEGADKRLIMTKKEYAAYRKLPNSVTLYGSGDPEKWYRDKAEAAFLTEAGLAIYKTKVSKEKILRCYFDAGKTLRCVCWPSKLEVITERIETDREVENILSAQMEEDYDGEGILPLIYDGELTQVTIKYQKRDQLELEYPFTPEDFETGPTFMEFLYGLIDEREYRKDSDFYKKAGLSRSQWGAYKTGKHLPDKPRAVQISIALGLDLEGTKDLLHRCGHSFMHSDEWDVFIMACFKHKEVFGSDFTLFRVNTYLQKFGLTPYLTDVQF